MAPAVPPWGCLSSRGALDCQLRLERPLGMETLGESMTLSCASIQVGFFLQEEGLGHGGWNVPSNQKM